jgi:arylsulfatase
MRIAPVTRRPYDPPALSVLCRRSRSVALALAAAFASGCPGGSRPPNLLLVTVDTLRADRLACYGGAPDLGTALCALAAEGTRYVWAFSTAPSTAPSIASVLTSRLPSEHGVTEFARSRLGDELESVAEVLAAAGYDTAAFVANPVLSKGRGLEQGFAIYDDRMRQRETHRVLLEREAAEITDAALAWLRVAHAPWFLWVHYQDPHGPYAPPGAPPASDPPGAAALAALDDQSGWHGIPAYQVLGSARAPATYESRYAEEIRWLDRHFARLLAAANTPERRTAIAVTADHGEALGEDDFWFAHGHSLGLEQIRVPLLWRGVESSEPRVVATPASTLDVAPALVAAAGLPPRPGFAGHALGTREGERAPIFAEHRLRLAVVLGSHYYARDREPFPAPVPEPITGGSIPPLPPRAATLDGDGRMPSYSLDVPAGLEALLAAFARDSARRPPDEAPALDPASREALRALGYLQ